MFAVACAFGDQEILAREDPVEVRIVVHDRLNRAADVGEKFSDLLGAPRNAPFREIELGVFREEVHDAAAVRCHPAVVERLEIFNRNGFALFVGHSLFGEGHCRLSLFYL